MSEERKNGHLNVVNFDSMKKAIIESQANALKLCESPIERLASFFEEMAAEIRSIEINSCHMLSVMAEVNKALIRTQEEIEEQEEYENASY